MSTENSPGNKFQLTMYEDHESGLHVFAGTAGLMRFTLDINQRLGVLSQMIAALSEVSF